MKKRFFAVIAAVVLAASFSGCKGKEPVGYVENTVSKTDNTDKTTENPGEEFPEVPGLTTPDHVLALKDKIKFLERDEDGSYTYDFGPDEEATDSMLIYVSRILYTEGLQIREAKWMDDDENVAVYDILKSNSSTPIGALALGMSKDTGHIICIFKFFKY